MFNHTLFVNLAKVAQHSISLFFGASTNSKTGRDLTIFGSAYLACRQYAIGPKTTIDGIRSVSAASGRKATH